MKKYGWKIGFIACLFTSTFFFHFLYDWFPNSFSIFFSPINESVFEHMKLISSAWLLMGSLDLLMNLKLGNPKNNPFLSMFLAALSGILFYLLCYMPFPSLSHSMPFIFSLLILTFGFSFFVYEQVEQKKIPYGISIGLIGWILLLSGLGYLSYHPVHHDLFFDTEEERYGLDEYVL